MKKKNQNNLLYYNSGAHFVPNTFEYEEKEKYESPSSKILEPRSDLPYQELKQDLALVLDALGREGRETRKHIQVEAKMTREMLIRKIDEGNLTIIDCLAYSSKKNIQAISLIGIFISVFSILISAILKVHIMHPFFAIMAAIASLGFYTMTKVQRSS